jgi:HrpA-like RNA helicase
MSATLDSNLFAAYFGGCQTLAAGGRTFPVEQVFLEDVYELTGYRLDPEGPSALRNFSDAAKRKTLQKATGSRQSIVKVGILTQPITTVLIHTPGS